MEEKYEVRVNGRLYEVSRGKERMEEITNILAGIYGKENVSVKKLRKNGRLYQNG